MTCMHLSQDAEWAREQVAGLHPRWQRRVLAHWAQSRGGNTSDSAEAEPRRRSNLDLLTITSKLNAVRLPLNAADAEICARADQLARECAGLTDAFHDVKALRAAMERVVRAYQCTPPPAERVTDDGVIRGVRDMGAIARMTCAQWWRKRLRTMHAACVEAAAIMLGFVGKGGNGRHIYISNESFERHQQQQKRNAEMLESTLLRNELEQEYVLAELAALGVANKRIRRAELMTRINGFEVIANDLGHIGMFFTLTPPSRMHRWRTLPNGRLVRNHRYDGTTPKEAQQYLTYVWGLIRSKLNRDGFQWYGVRSAQPHHDGSPHWHGVVFFPPSFDGLDAYEYLCAVIRGYALQDSPDEPGAREHRCDFKPIDRDKGTAAGYVLRYVVRATDGEGLGHDMFNQPADIAAKRINAWASTWGIHLFEQIGGPPVGVWREMRRVKALPAEAPEPMRAAHGAVNRLAPAEGEVQPASWRRFVEAMGGVFATRKTFRVQLHKEQTGRVGRYGDALPAQVRGVKASGIKVCRDGDSTRVMMFDVVAESVRHVWEVVRRGARDGSRAAEGRPWTRVNNCTRDDRKPHSQEADYREDRQNRPVENDVLQR